MVDFFNDIDPTRTSAIISCCSSEDRSALVLALLHSAPDIAGKRDDELKLSHLVVFGNYVAFYVARESALWTESQKIVIDEFARSVETTH